jgi:hypothetical protein
MLFCAWNHMRFTWCGAMQVIRAKARLVCLSTWKSTCCHNLRLLVSIQPAILIAIHHMRNILSKCCATSDDDGRLSMMANFRLSSAARHQPATDDRQKSIISVLLLMKDESPLIISVMLLMIGESPRADDRRKPTIYHLSTIPSIHHPCII